MNSQVQRIALGSGIHTAEWLVSTRAGQELLATARNSDRRPRCMCVSGGVEMYVARRGQNYYLSRMPGTGFLHAGNCDSVDDTTIFSGISAYAPGVIIEQGDGSLRVTANLERRDRQEDPVTEVGIDGLLDVLVEQADLNRVSAGAEPRSWSSVRDRLMEASSWVSLGNGTLADFLFLPGAYSRETGAATLADCEGFLKDNPGTALICAPLKDLKLTTYSWQVVLKHLPGLRLWASKEYAEDMEQRWGLAHFHTPPTYALCLVAVRPGRREGNHTVINMACLPTDANYLPCRTEQDAKIASQLLEDGKSLLRPLRFDISLEEPLADYAILARETPKPVFVLAPSGNAEFDSAKRSLAALLQRNKADVLVFGE